MELIGIVGMLFILGGYFWLLYGDITHENKWYLLLMGLGGAILTVYAILLNSIPFILINSIFSIGSFVKLQKVR